MQRKSDVDTRNGNRMMLKNQAVEFKHHAKELSDAVKKAKHVDAWVVAKAERATTDLSDITHYLEGQEAMKSGEKYSLGGMSREYNTGSGMSFDDIQVGETYYAYDTTLKKVVKVVVKDIMGKDYDPYNYEKEKVVYDVYDIDGDKLLRQEKVHDGGSSGTTSVTQKNGSINYLQTRISWRDYFANFFKTKEDAENHSMQKDDEIMAHGGQISLSNMTDGEAIEHANKILISELGEGANSLFFDSGYAARRFIREYHVRPVEITEEDVRDYFDDDSSMSDEAKEILQKYSDIKHDADTLAAMRSELEEVGYTFDYDKDNVPYLLRDKMSEEDTMAEGGIMAFGGRTSVSKTYEPIQGTTLEYKIHLFYDKGGLNYYNNKQEARGYYLSVTPVLREYRGNMVIEGYQAYSGFKELILPVQRQSDKSAAQAEQMAISKIPLLKQEIRQSMIQSGEFKKYEKKDELTPIPQSTTDKETPKSIDTDAVSQKKRPSREDIQAAIDALEILAETGNEKAKDAIEGMKLLLEDLPEISGGSSSGGNNEDYIINMLKGKYYKVIPEGMQDSDIVVEIKDVKIDDPKYRDRFVSLISGKDGYADERIPLSKIDAFLNGEEIVLRDDKEYYAVKLMGNLAKGGIMAHGGQIESKRDELLDSLYPEIKELFAKNGLRLDEDYGFTDGSNKSYLPYFSHQRVGDTLQKVVVSYYEDGYEVIGEIEIELEDGIEIEVEFPSMGIKEKKEGFMAKGGMMAKGGEIVPYLLWVSKDGMKRELYGEYKSHRAAQMAMKKVWREGLDYQEIGITPKSEFQKYGYFKDGGMMKKVGATFAEKVNAISARLDGMIVPSRLRKDYGRRYNKAEAKLAAQRIAGAMRKKGY